MRFSPSRPQKSEYAKVFATVQKAAAKGRQLTVDKKGNLKYRGVFSNFFLRCKVSFQTKKEYTEYCLGERNKIRSEVLAKLESVGKQARREAILNTRTGTMDSDSEKASLNSFLDRFIEIRQKSYRINELSEQFGNNDFNTTALDFLSRSKTVTYTRKPVCPDFYYPDRRLSDHEGLTTFQKAEIRAYRESLKIYEATAASKTILEHTDFLEPPGLFPDAPQGRVRFLSEPTEKLMKAIDKHGGADEDPSVLERADNYSYGVLIGDPVGARPQHVDSPRTVWNQADFEAHSEKRVLAEGAKRKRLAQVPVGQDINDQAVDFLCFLRKNVQTQFTRDGGLPEHLQPYFNENSAVSIPDSTAQPDRLVPSKRLVAMVVNLCMGSREEAPQAAVEKKTLAFSDEVGVREITSRDADRRLLQFAVHDGQLKTTPSEERLIMRDKPDSRPVTAEAAIDGVTHHYEEKSLPDGFEKYVPDGGEDPAATDRNDEGAAGSGLVGSREEPVGSSDRSWIKEQYASWSVNEISHEESQAT